MEELASYEDLLDLQRLDSAIDRLLERRQSLPELERYRVATDESDLAGERLAGLEERLRESQLAVDKAEGELEIMDQRVEQTEQRLFAGGMSARETEAMRQDVEQLRRQQSELETTVLEGLEERDELEKEVAAAREEAEQTSATKQALEGTIAEAWKEIDNELARHEARKHEIVPTTSPELLELYEKLRGLKDGVAIASLEDGVCGGCHLKLSAAELKEALASDPPRCTHCRRILVP